MTYTAMLYITFKQRDGSLDHQLIRKIPVEADSLSKAKLQTTRLIKKDPRFSQWHTLNPTSRWSPLIEENRDRFVRKVFRSVPPRENLPGVHHAFVDIVIRT